MLYLLDTDHVSLTQREGDRSTNLRFRLTLIPADDVGISIVTYQEQLKGRLATCYDAKTAQEQAVAYASLHNTLRYYLRVAVWDYTPLAAQIFADLKNQKIATGTQDLKIAAIALANDATLLTCNTRDFARVPLLRFEDWSVATDE